MCRCEPKSSTRSSLPAEEAGNTQSVMNVCVILHIQRAVYSAQLSAAQCVQLKQPRVCCVQMSTAALSCWLSACWRKHVELCAAGVWVEKGWASASGTRSILAFTRWMHRSSVAWKQIDDLEWEEANGRKWHRQLGRADRSGSSPETMVAYMKQTGSDEWGGEETGTYTGSTGESTLGLIRGATVCDAGQRAARVILNHQSSPSEALKFGPDPRM